MREAVCKMNMKELREFLKTRKIPPFNAKKAELVELAEKAIETPEVDDFMTQRKRWGTQHVGVEDLEHADVRKVTRCRSTSPIK